MSQQLKLLGATLDISASPSVADFSKFAKFKISKSLDNDAIVRNDSVDTKISNAVTSASSIPNPTFSNIKITSLNTPGVLHNNSNGVITSSKLISGEIDTNIISYFHLDTSITNGFLPKIIINGSIPSTSTLGTKKGHMFTSDGYLYICHTSDTNGVGAIWKKVKLYNKTELSNFSISPIDYGSSAYIINPPLSNTAGEFSYISKNTNIATISTIMSPYTITNPSISTLPVTNFPSLGLMSNWVMNIKFNVTGGANTQRALVGDMYNNTNSIGWGWGVWISSGNHVYFSWNGQIWESLINVSLNTNYILTITRTPLSMTMALTNVAMNYTQTDTNNLMSSYVISTNAPVTIGDWINNTKNNSIVTISYITVYDTSLPFINIVNAGTTTLIAKHVADGNFVCSNISSTFVVNTILPTITLSVPTLYYKSPFYEFTLPTSNSNGSISYSIEDTSIADISIIDGMLFNNGSAVLISNRTQFNITNNITIECLFKTSVNAPLEAQQGVIFAKGNAYRTSGNNSSSFSIGLTREGYAYVYIATTANYINITSEPNIYSDKKWHAMSATYNSSTGFLALYVDGYMVSSMTNSYLSSIILGNSGWPLIIGNDVAGVWEIYAKDRQFNGIIADVRLWNVIRSTTDMYSKSKGLSFLSDTTGLVGLWKLNEKSGNVLYDSSSYANNGTMWYEITPTNNILINIKNIGTTNIIVNQSAFTNYKSHNIKYPLTITDIQTTSLPTLSNFTVPSGKRSISQPFQLTPPSSTSKGAFTYSVPQDNGVVTISGNTVTPRAEGIVTITATQAASGDYASGNITAVLTIISSIPPLIDFNIPPMDYGSSAYVINRPLSISAGSFSYTIDDTSIATVSNTASPFITIVAGGSTTITATQAAYGEFISNTISVPLIINAITPVLSNFSVLSSNTDISKSFTLTAPSSPSNGAFTYSASPSNMVTISGNTITSIATVEGTVTITATQSSSRNYSVNSITASLTIILPSLSNFTVPSNKTNISQFQLIPPTSPSAGVFTYSASPDNIVTISGNTVTSISTGTVIITATQAPSGGYTSNFTTASLTIISSTPLLSNFSIPAMDYGSSIVKFSSPSSNSNGDFSYSISDTSIVDINDVNNINCISFNGNNSFIFYDYCQQYVISSAITMECLFKTNINAPLKSAATLLSRYQTGGISTLAAYSIGLTSEGYAYVTITGTSNNFFMITSTPNVYSDTKWHSIVATYNSSTGYLALYVDSVLVNSSTNSSFGNIATNNFINLFIGNDHAGVYNNSTDRQFNGFIAGVRLWNVARSQSQVYGNYSTYNAVLSDTTGLVGYWKLNETSGTIAVDSSSYNSNGSLGNCNRISPYFTLLTKKIGTTSIKATQVAYGDFVSNNISSTLTINAVTPVLSNFIMPTNKTNISQPFTITAPSSPSSGAFTYSVPQNNEVVTISGNNVTVLGIGTVTITATQALSGGYTSNFTTAVLTIFSSTFALSNFIMPTNKTNISQPFTITAPSSPSSGAFTYSAPEDNPNYSGVISISGNTITVLGRINIAITITATQAAWGDFNAPTPITSQLVIYDTYFLNVVPRPSGLYYNDSGSYPYYKDIFQDQNRALTYVRRWKTSEGSRMNYYSGNRSYTYQAVNNCRIQFDQWYGWSFSMTAEGSPVFKLIIYSSGDFVEQVFNYYCNYNVRE